MKKRYLFLISFFIISVIYTVINNKQKTYNDSKYIKSLNLSLKGKIVNISPLGSGSGLLNLEIEKSNYNFLDDRKEKENYFIVIKNNIADLFIIGISNIKINDSIIIEDKIKIYRDGVMIDELGINLTPNKHSLSPIDKKLIREIKMNHKI